jgi:hypothetical protein
MIGTQTGASVEPVRTEGTYAVLSATNRYGALVALAMAVALPGCANLDFDSSAGWFSKPLDVTGRSGGFAYSELQENRRQRAIGPNELVDGSGACPPPPAPAAVPAAPGATPAAPADGTSILGEAVALGMSECDVVNRAGQPSAVQLGKNPNGDRTAVLTYNSGPRPGVYHFERGALMEMDRTAMPAQAQTPAAPKKKPIKSAKNNQT